MHAKVLKFESKRWPSISKIFHRIINLPNDREIWIGKCMRCENGRKRENERRNRWNNAYNMWTKTQTVYTTTASVSNHESFLVPDTEGRSHSDIKTNIPEVLKKCDIL